MGTSSTETLSVAGNIFVGQVIFCHHSYNAQNYLKKSNVLKHFMTNLFVHQFIEGEAPLTQCWDKAL